MSSNMTKYDRERDTLAFNGIIVEDVPQGIFELINIAFSCVLIQISSLVGLVCSSLTVVVLSQFNITTDSANILLLSLTVADFLFCMTVPISRLNCLLVRILDTQTVTTVNISILQMFSTLSRWFYVISITMGGVIAAERFVVVFFPLKAAGVLTPNRIIIVCASVYIVNFALLCPGMFCFRKEWMFDPTKEIFVEVLVPTDFYLSHFEALNFELAIFHNNIFTSSFLILTLILTPAIAVKLWMLVSERSKLTQRRCSFDPTAAKIMMTVCTVNLLLYGPVIYFNLATYLVPNYSLLSTSYQVFMIITDFTGTLCASVNFVVYAKLSTKFKKKFEMLIENFCCWKPQR
ncbi:somatostatin receptor type 5 [Biomphalaria glabrata]|nr:somatostatin receptor type 5 [Biomphalaria glabrata]